jgi:hypothetical protein
MESGMIHAFDRMAELLAGMQAPQEKTHDSEYVSEFQR